MSKYLLILEFRFGMLSLVIHFLMRAILNIHASCIAPTSCRFPIPDLNDTDGFLLFNCNEALDLC